MIFALLRPGRRAAAALAATALVASLPAVPAAARAMDVATLVTRNALATGAARRPVTERELWSVRLDGLDGTLAVVRRETTQRSDLALGPFTTHWGSSATAGWRQDDNGRTTPEPAPATVAPPVGAVVARVSQPFDAWTVTTSLGGGRFTRVFYDPRTYLIVRVERVERGRVAWTAYGDFRTTASGRTRPWRYDGGDDRSGEQYEYRLVRDDADVRVTEAELAPPPERALVEFPAERDGGVPLPARIVDGRAYVRLTIAGRPLDFLLDTGSSSLAISDDVARQLELPAYGRTTTATAAGTFATRRVIAREIDVGPLAMHDVALRTIPSESRPGDVPVAGLLGFDFLSAAGLRIDYDAGTIEAWRPGALPAPDGAYAVDLRLLAGLPLVAAGIGPATSDAFVLDSGAAFSIVLFQRFARSHPAAVAMPADDGVQLGDGVGGEMAYRDLQATNLTLGMLDFPQTATVEALAPRALGLDGVDGLVGSDLLRRFTLYVDYAAAKIWLAPGERTTVRRVD